MIIYDSYINKAEGTGVNYRHKIFNEARRRGLSEEMKGYNVSNNNMEKRISYTTRSRANGWGVEGMGGGGKSTEGMDARDPWSGEGDGLTGPRDVGSIPFGFENRRRTLLCAPPDWSRAVTPHLRWLKFIIFAPALCYELY